MRRRIEFDHLPAHHDVLVQLVAAQVEEAVFEPDLLRIFLVAEHRHRQFGGGPEHLDLADIDLDRAGRQIRVLGAFRALAHLAVDPHHPFRAQRLGDLEGRQIRVGHHLGQSVVVAQVDEQHAAVVADAVAPAGEPHVLADVGLAERAAGIGAVAMHVFSPGESRRGLSPKGRKSTRRPGFVKATAGGDGIVALS